MADTQKRPKLPSFTSPKGIFKWPRLNEPDTKFRATGEYSVKLVLDADTAAPLIEKLQPLWDEAVAAGQAEWDALKPPVQKKNPFKTVDFYSPEYDEDGDETGNTEFNFKMNASGTTKAGKAWTRKPAIFDAKGKIVGKSTSIWGGTVGKVSFEAMPFFVAAVGAGLSLRLQAVQVIELVEGGTKSAEGYGFGEEEGYAAEDEPAFGDESGDDSTKTTNDGEGDF